MHAADIQRKKSFAERKLRKENRGKTQEDENPSLLDGWFFLVYFFKSQRVFLYHFRVVYLKKDGMVDWPTTDM